jgi:hypothetical protein
MLGLFMLGLAALALVAGGTASPVVFGLAGAVALAWPLVPKSFLYRVSPVADSVLLKGSVAPFLWMALAEVKFEEGTQAVAASSLDGTLVFFGGRPPSACLAVRCWALGYREAEGKVTSAIQEVGRTLAPRGAYIIPLDSSDAASRTSGPMVPLDVAPEELVAQAVSFDVLVLESRRGRVSAFGAFRKSPGSGRATLPSARVKPVRPPLLAEVALALEKRGGLPPPDPCTAFLASLSASRGEPLLGMVSESKDGDAFIPVGDGMDGVRLSRPQLRALSSTYGPR